MPNRYPQEAALRDGRRVLLRPFNRRDVDALHAFFQRLPEDHRRFAWDQIGDRTLVEKWGQGIDYTKVFPLLALDGTRIVAEATLTRIPAGPLRLVGRVHWFLDPEARELGLGSVMVNHFIAMARNDGLRHLTCMLISDLEASAIKTLAGLGFQAYHVPGYGTDPDGDQHDMTKMVLRL